MKLINCRSDTQTLPTQAMMDAVAAAELGDDMYGEDPTVQALQERAAAMLGKEAALLVLSGTMGNLASLMAHAGPGDEVFIDPDSHIYYYEGGGVANIAGLMPQTLKVEDGLVDADAFAASIRSPRAHYPTPRLLCLENTHNRSGGRVIPLDHQNRLCDIAHEHGLAVHLDGARLFNAAIALDVPASAVAEHVDSVMFCLSKGLSCPLGSIVAGTRDFISKVEVARSRLGGGMRQAGVIAAPGLVALDSMIDRLRDDHRNAADLAAGIDGLDGFSVDLDSVQSSMVYIDHQGTGLSTTEVMKRLRELGIIVSGRPPHHVRVVTSRHIDAAAVQTIIACFQEVLAGAHA